MLFLQNLPRYPCAGLCIGEGVVVVIKIIATGCCYGVELVVLKMGKKTTGGAEGVVELVIGVVHAIDTEDSFQTALVKGLVVRHKG